MATITLGWGPPAEVPTVSNDCIVTDSSGRILAFSLSENIRFAKFANDLISIFSALRYLETSGKNSKAPIPRFPINDSLSRGVISAFDK